MSLKTYQQSVHPLTEKMKRLRKNLTMFRVSIVDTFKSTANLESRLVENELDSRWKEFLELPQSNGI